MEQTEYFKSKFVSLLFFRKKLQLISEISSLSADCLPSLIKASGCGVSTSQLSGRGVENFFHPIRITVKNHKVYHKYCFKISVRDETVSNPLFRQKGFYLNFLNEVDWSRCSRLLLRKASAGETPQVQRRRGGFRTDRANGPTFQSTFKLF